MHVIDAEVLAHDEITARYFVLKLRAPEIAAGARPGQFVQIRCHDSLLVPLLPRPFSIMTADTTQGTIELLYRVEGIGTRMLSTMRPGTRLPLWGPLGNSFEASWGGISIIVGGGIGIPPLRMLFETQIGSGFWSVNDTRVLLGARSADEVVCASVFQSYGLGLGVATDDGSWGHHGVVTDLLQLELNSAALSGMPVQVYACGPYPMLRAVAELCAQAEVACQVCMEAPMPCGIGVCMGCVIPLRIADCGLPIEDPGDLQSSILNPQSSISYLRCCCEGPVFEASEVIWE